MVGSYRTLLADGSIVQAGGRPPTANSSSSRVDPAGGVKVFSNGLHSSYADGGDILAAQAAAVPVPAAAGAPSPQQVVPAPPPGRRLPSGNSNKFLEQRALAAQKRLERLQLGGVAQASDGIAVVTLAASHPGTPASRPASAAAAASPGMASTAAPHPPWAGGAGGGSNGGGGGSASGPTPAGAAERNLVARGLAAIYDPAAAPEARRAPEQQWQEAAPVRPDAGGGPRVPLAPVPAAQLDVSDMAAFLTRPGPRSGPVLCYIERDKGSVSRPPCYRMFMDDGRLFLLAARKRVKAATSTYVVSSSATDLGRDGPSYVGRLRSNFLGTEFTMHGRSGGGGGGCSSRGDSAPRAAGSLVAAASSLQAAPQRQRGSGTGGRETQDSEAGSSAAASESEMRELAAVVYERNLLGTRGPRKMAVAVPAPAASGADGMDGWRPLDSGAAGTLLAHLTAGAPDGGSTGGDAAVLRNKTPKWNEALNAYCLNFSGRVSEASVKNFQLVVAEGDGDAVALQFGKLSANRFTCDFMWPLSPLQAFCICITSLDNKLACE